MTEFDKEDNGGEGSSQRLTPSQSRQTSSPRQDDTPQTEQSQSRVRRPKTQGANLPDKKDIKLNKGIKLLLNGSNLARWKRQIENGLSIVSIDKVANYKLPRPDEEDPDYDLWEYWSKIACGWIETLLDQEIITILEGGVDSFPRRADDMMRKVETLVRGAGIVDNYNQLGLHRVEPHPFGAMFVMLYGLEEELESVKFTYQTMKDMIPEEVTKETFNNLCKKLIVEARRTPASSSTATASSARNTDTKKNETSQRGGGRVRGRGGRGHGGSRNTQTSEKQEKQDPKPQKDQQPKRFKNGPPKGKSIDE
ncbi:unnamed protein product [Penicillium discolor]